MLAPRLLVLEIFGTLARNNSIDLCMEQLGMTLNRMK
jgi:hypothetical protein